MSLEWTQVEAALSSSTLHFEDANKSILQFCRETGKKVNETSSNLEVVRRDVHALKQQAEDNITSLNVCRAQGESHDDRLGHLERRLAEVEQDNRSWPNRLRTLKPDRPSTKTPSRNLRGRWKRSSISWCNPLRSLHPSLRTQINLKP